MAKTASPKSTQGLNKGVHKESENEMFSIVEDGNGYKYRVANMASPIICPKKGTIQIEAIKRTKGKEPNIRVSNVYDASLDLWYGIPTGIDPVSKRLQWRSFFIGDFRQYNLSNEADRQEWSVVSRCTYMEGSTVFPTSRKLYRKYDVEAEAEREIAAISSIETAVGIIKGMRLTEEIAAARAFGKAPEGMSQTKIKAELYRQAKNNPFSIIEYWNSKNRSVIDVYNGAKSTGLITYNMNKGYMYKNGTPLGSTELLAMEFLTKDPEFLMAVAQEVKLRDKSQIALEGAEQGGDNASEEFTMLRIKAKNLGVPNFDQMTQDELETRVGELEEKLNGFE